MLRLLNLPIWIEWDKFKPETSIFIPCLQRHAVANFVKKEARRLGYTVVCKHVIERGIYGLRVWRTA